MGDLIASPWTAPTWMKATGEFVGYGSLIGHPIPDKILVTDKYFRTWANYFVKFAQAYQAQGIDVDYFTIQNLPTNGISGKPYLPIPQTAMGPVDEANFFVNYLWPAFVAAGIDIPIIAVDDYTPELSNDANALYGIAAQAGLYDKIAAT